MRMLMPFIPRRQNSDCTHSTLRSFLRAAATLFIAVPLVGCFSRLEQRPSGFAKQPISPLKQEDLGRSIEVFTSKPLNEETIDLQFVSGRSCLISQTPRYQLVETRHYEASGVPGALAFGTLALGGGAALAIDGISEAKHAYGSESKQRVAVELLAAAGVLTLGGMATGRAIYHMAQSGEEELPPVVYSDTPITTHELCREKPIPGARIELRLRANGRPASIDLGATDRNGHLVVNLSDEFKKLFWGWPNSEYEVDPTATIVAGTAPNEHRILLDLDGGGLGIGVLMNNSLLAQRRRQQQEQAEERRRELQERTAEAEAWVKEWARVNLDVNTVVAESEKPRCYNAVDYEVSCTSSAAVRVRRGPKRATVRIKNNSKSTVTCGAVVDFAVNMFTSDDPIGVEQVVKPGRAEAWSRVHSNIGDLGVQVRAYCTITALAKSEAPGLSEDERLLRERVRVFTDRDRW